MSLRILIAICMGILALMLGYLSYVVLRKPQYLRGPDRSVARPKTASVGRFNG